MTYLQLVNAVMKRLRESTVTSVDQNTYSALVGELVNESKRIVENAWDWEALRSDITFNTSDGDYIYTCLLYTSPSPRDGLLSRMPSSA